MIYDYALSDEYSKDKGVWAADPDSYRPIRKIKGFKPNPLISEDHKVQRLPIWADGRNNPSCIGTSDYWEFWEEQIRRCMNGYETGNIWIPGRYYYYLNFVKISGVFGLQYPWYLDLDLEYFRTVEYIKEKRKLGLISIKARRKGLSEKAHTILGHGLRFINAYKAGVTAGDDKYVIGIRAKFEHAQNNMSQDMQLKTLNKDDDVYKIGYYEKNDLGTFIRGGFENEIRFATMYDKATKLEGEYFNDVIMEESGQFPKLGEAFESIKPALMMGSYIGGTFYIFGTGGNILSSSKDFMEMFNEAENLGLVKFWVSARRMLFPFFGNPKSLWGKPVDDDDVEEEYGMPSFEGWEEYEFKGCEDIWAAEKWVLSTRERYSKLRSKKKLIKHNQSFPLTVEEAFTSSGSNNFNADLLYKQLHRIYDNDEKIYDYILDFVYEKDDDGILQLKYPLEVKRRLATKDDPDWKKVQMYKTKSSMVNLDVAGVDSYNQDQSNTSKSLGAMVVLRRNNLIPNADEKGLVPICGYYHRPPKKEQFYEICLKIAVFYGLYHNVMVSAEHDFIMDYFIKNGGQRYLAERPKSFDAPNSQPTNKYGYKMTGESKPRVLGHLQTLVDEHSEYIWFPYIIRDFLAYDEENIGTDWDIADAMALAYIRILDMKKRPKEKSHAKDFKYMNELPDIENENINLDQFEVEAFSETVTTTRRNKRLREIEYQRELERQEMKEEVWMSL